jgi:hypothetical protein
VYIHNLVRGYRKKVQRAFGFLNNNNKNNTSKLSQRLLENAYLFGKNSDVMYIKHYTKKYIYGQNGETVYTQRNSKQKSVE